MNRKSMEERFLALPMIPEEVVQQCETCGKIQPAMRLEFYGTVRYSTRRCSCQEKAIKSVMISEQRAAIFDAQSRHTYTWLGGTFTDTSLREKTFENFDQFRQQEAYSEAVGFAESLSGILILYGSFGTGKTHLLAAICNEALLKHDRSSLFTTSANLFSAIQRRIHDNEDIQGLIHRAACTPLLCIDDIDKTKWTEWREEIYFAIVDERTKRGLPIAISTNRIDDLAHYVGGAVASRLKMGRIAVEMIGADYREEL